MPPEAQWQAGLDTNHNTKARTNSSPTVLIAMAILQSPKKMLGLAEIYRWISGNYSFYSASEIGRQNCIRHNLSLHKCFIKIQNPNSGKGSYWSIEAGAESQFLEAKRGRKSTRTVKNTIKSTHHKSPRPTLAPIDDPTLPPPVLISQAATTATTAMTAALTTAEATPPTPVELSSDVHIAILDNPTLEEFLEKSIDSELPLDASTPSPLPTSIRPSPTVARHAEHGSNGPSVSHNSTPSTSTQPHKRKFASMEDSGYISLYGSTTIQPKHVLTTEADRLSIKRGRAEAEIARLRQLSPSGLAKGGSTWSFDLSRASSTPSQRAHDKQLLTPLTPAAKIEPFVHPPCVSTSTDLRIHHKKVRDMLQSPICRVTDMDDFIPWSPIFSLDDAT
ncbi:fork head domain-containing protein [Ilyonectria sp. MPI-CAGE-AT-0026]|nr:fork head domain-containing protein [Ilyonectria sp. MPI-CAGE-AT-0026]